MPDKERVHELITELGALRGKGATENEIQEMENQLGLLFPAEYREFLQIYGWLKPPFIIEGIFGGGKDAPHEYSVVQQTQELREFSPEAFAKNLAAVYWVGDGNFECVVCDGKDRGKVIFWQHDVSPDEVYPNDPDFWIEAVNFWEWLHKNIEMAKEANIELKRKPQLGSGK